MHPCRQATLLTFAVKRESFAQPAFKAIECEIGEHRRDYAPYTKGNFQFERVVKGWRNTPILDLRLKK